jgi:hypothetical protein
VWHENPGTLGWSRPYKQRKLTNFNTKAYSRRPPYTSMLRMSGWWRLGRFLFFELLLACRVFALRYILVQKSVSQRFKRILAAPAFVRTLPLSDSPNFIFLQAMSSTAVSLSIINDNDAYLHAMTMCHSWFFWTTICMTWSTSYLFVENSSASIFRGRFCCRNVSVRKFEKYRRTLALNSVHAEDAC